MKALAPQFSQLRGRDDQVAWLAPLAWICQCENLGKTMVVFSLLSARDPRTDRELIRIDLTIRTWQIKQHSRRDVVALA